jgi:hypothetical protein
MARVDEFVVDSIRFIDNLMDALERKGRTSWCPMNGGDYINVTDCISAKWDEWEKFDADNILDLEVSIDHFWTPILEDNFPSLEVEKLRESKKYFIEKWMNGGSFYESLCEALTNADSDNIKKLYQGFPKVVEGYVVYSTGKSYPEWLSN